MQTAIHPYLSVIIAAHNGKSILLSCLSALKKQCYINKPVQYEVIVVGYFNNKLKKSISEKYPEVNLLQTSSPSSVPALRSIGIMASKGDIIALLEDHCIPAKDWVQSILTNHHDGYSVVGGAVENACTRRIVDWAVYFFEYSVFMNPISEEKATTLPGNNVYYNRPAIQYFEDMLEQNLWEPFWHERLIKNGIVLYASSNMVVYHNRSFSIMRFWQLSFIHGCNHAVAGLYHSNFKKILWIILAVFFPFILTFRIGRRVLNKQRYLKEFIKASPIILWFYIGWTMGEVMGTFSGQAIKETGWGE